MINFLISCLELPARLIALAKPKVLFSAASMAFASLIRAASCLLTDLVALVVSELSFLVALAAFPKLSSIFFVLLLTRVERLLTAVATLRKSPVTLRSPSVLAPIATVRLPKLPLDGPAATIISSEVSVYYVSSLLCNGY